MITLLAIVLVLFALMGLRIGWRGVVVSSVQQCRQCGYDLRGAPNAPRCSECGSDLSSPGAVKTELRRKRPLLLSLSIVLLLLGGGTTLPSVQQSARSVFSIQNAPQWWLRRSLLSANRTTCDTAASELRRRVADGTLDASDGNALLESLRARQSSASLIWSDAIRALADEALSKGLLSDKDTLAEFLADSIRLETSPAIESPQFASWPMVRVTEWRSFSRHLLELDPEKVDIHLVGYPTLVCEDRFSSYSMGRQDKRGVINSDGSDHISFIQPGPLSYLALLGPGKHRVRLRLKYTVAIRDLLRLVESLPTDVPKTQHQFEFEGEVLVPETPINAAEPDDAFFSDMRIFANDTSGGSHITLNHSGNRPTVLLQVPAPKADFAGLVYMKDPRGQLWLIDDVRFSRGRKSLLLVYASEDSNPTWKNFDATHVTLIIESSPFVAFYSQLPGPFLVGRRVFENVEVRRDSH